MSLIDEIDKRTQLPKPLTPVEFETIQSSSDDEEDPPIILNKICKAKNPKLYNPDPEDFLSFDGGVNNGVKDFEITSRILEINGGDCYSNQAIEKQWRARINEKRDQEKHSDDNKIVKHDIPKIELPKNKKSHKLQYKNNMLMRNLLEKKMANLQLAELASSSSNSGKNSVNNPPIDDLILTASPDDPDFFFLKDTKNMTEFNDKNFHFEYRGVKKQVTPRQYSIYEIDDDEFIFRKQS